MPITQQKFKTLQRGDILAAYGSEYEIIRAHRIQVGHQLQTQHNTLESGTQLRLSSNLSHWSIVEIIPHYQQAPLINYKQLSLFGE